MAAQYKFDLESHDLIQEVVKWILVQPQDFEIPSFGKLKNSHPFPIPLFDDEMYLGHGLDGNIEVVLGTRFGLGIATRDAHTIPDTQTVKNAFTAHAAILTQAADRKDVALSGQGSDQESLKDAVDLLDATAQDCRNYGLDLGCLYVWPQQAETPIHIYFSFLSNLINHRLEPNNPTGYINPYNVTSAALGACTYEERRLLSYESIIAQLPEENRRPFTRPPHGKVVLLAPK